MIWTGVFFFFLSTQQADSSLDFEFAASENLKTWKSVATFGSDEVLLALEKPDQSQTFTVREFQVPSKTLKSHVASWLRDYKSYGFKIEQNRPLMIGKNNKAYLVSAKLESPKRHFVQIMTLKNKRLLTLTCQNKETTKDLKSCVQAAKSFNWKKEI